MKLLDLPTEILLTIFQHCSSITDLTNFFRTCRHTYSVLSTSQKTLVYYRVAESQFGPLHDIIQLLTLNSSQPIASVRDPPRSSALLQQILSVGRVAKRWEGIYPCLKWDSDFANRRSLAAGERYRLRRAIYRYWLYVRAFHNASYPRTSRRVPHIVRQRLALLQNWSTKELIELEDFQDAMRDTISNTVCPSDSLLRSLNIRDGLDCLSCYHKQTISIPAQDYFHTSQSHCIISEHSSRNAAGCTGTCAGFGDAVTHYYLVEDLLKVDPGTLLWLYDRPQKWHVQIYLDTLEEWFFNNGDTLAETVNLELETRGLDPAEGRPNAPLGIVEDLSTINAPV